MNRVQDVLNVLSLALESGKGLTALLCTMLMVVDAVAYGQTVNPKLYEGPRPIQVAQAAPLQTRPAVQEDPEVAKARQALEEAERRAADRKRIQQVLTEAQRQAELKAEQQRRQMEKQAEVSPQIFKENPTRETTEERQVNGYTVQTYTRFEAFEILPPSDGSNLSISVMRMGIQEAVRGPNAENFAREFRAAKDRTEQESVLRKYNENVARYKEPESKFDPSTFTCASDPNTPPAGFPTSPRSADNPGGYTVIRRFGVNQETRMGPPVTDLKTFIKQIPTAEKAIVERLPDFVDFRDRAELADILHRIAVTGELDGLVAKEDWTRNYPYRRFSTGAGRPLPNVWFRPDERGMQERGIRIVSRFSGRVYFVNYQCGLNIDEIAGCMGQMVMADVIKVTTFENFLRCRQISVPGKTPVRIEGTQTEPIPVYLLGPNERVMARVEAEATGGKVRESDVPWVWRLNANPIGRQGELQMLIGGDMLVGGATTLSVESLEPSAPGSPATIRACMARFIGAPKANCEAITTELKDGRIYVTVPLSDPGNIVSRLEFRLDNRVIPASDVRKEIGNTYSFPAAITDYEDHVVNVRVLDQQGNTLDECPGKYPGNIVRLPEAKCDAFTVRTEGDRIYGTVRYTDTAKLTARIEIRVNNAPLAANQVRQERNGTISFPRNLLPAGETQYRITAVGFDRLGRMLWECSGPGREGIITPPPEPCPTCTATIVGKNKLDSKRDAQGVYLNLRASVSIPAGVQLTISEFRISGPGMKNPVFLQGQDVQFVTDHLPHDNKGRLVPGTYVGVYVYEYKRADGSVCRQSCPVEIKVSKGRSWWPLLLIPAAVVGALLLKGKSKHEKEPIKRPIGPGPIMGAAGGVHYQSAPLGAGAAA